MSAFSLASVLGLPIGLWLANQSSWHTPFFVLVVLGMIVWGFALYALPRLRGHLEQARRRSFVQQTAEVFGYATHWWAFALTVVTIFGQFSVIPYITVYMTANVGFPESHLPLVYLVGGSFTFFTSRFIGRWSDRIGKPAVFARMTLLSIGPLLLLTHLPRVPVWTAIVVSTLFMITISGRMVPMMALVTGTVPPQIRGSFMSVNQAIQQLSSGTAAFVAGWMIMKGPDGRIQHYNWVGYMAVAFTGVALLVLRRLVAAQAAAGRVR